MDESVISNTRYFRKKTIPLSEITSVVITPLRGGTFGSELIEVRGEKAKFSAVWRMKDAAPLVRRLEEVAHDKISYQNTNDLSFFKKLIHLDE